MTVLLFSLIHTLESSVPAEGQSKIKSPDMAVIGPGHATSSSNAMHLNSMNESDDPPPLAFGTETRNCKLSRPSVSIRKDVLVEL